MKFFYQLQEGQLFEFAKVNPDNAMLYQKLDDAFAQNLSNGATIEIRANEFVREVEVNTKGN